MFRDPAVSPETACWTKTFTDPHLCAAIVDPLTFGGNLIQTGTESSRVAITQARATAQDTAMG
jgi:hypothetical protein